MSKEQETNASTPIESVAAAIRAFMLFGGFCAGGLIAIMLSAFLGNLPVNTGLWGLFFYLAGHGIIALPVLCAFVFKFGAFVDVGPVFYTHDNIVGNVIYRVTERDYTTQGGMNVVLTLLKLFLFFLISIVLTPIITVILYIIYIKARKGAVKYAEENGIDRESVPSVNKNIVIAIIGVLAALLVGTIIGSALSGSIRDKERDEADAMYATLFVEISKGLPSEYYAEAYKGASAAGGYIVEFELDGKKVYHGELSSNFSLVEGLSAVSKYYIIDGVVYLDAYSIGKYEISESVEIKEYLLSRHLGANIGEGAVLKSGNAEGELSRLVYTYNDKEHCVLVDSDKKIAKTQLVYDYTDRDTYDKMPETAFEFDYEKDLTEFKNKVRDILTN